MGRGGAERPSFARPIGIFALRVAVQHEHLDVRGVFARQGGIRMKRRHHSRLADELGIVCLCSSCSIILARYTSDSARPSSTAIWMYFCCGCDQMCVAVVLNHTKNGLLSLPFLSR